jgi:DNA polymerase I
LGRDELSGKTLLLLDGNSLINRAYFGLLGRQNLTAPDGTPTGALFAFLNMYLRYVEDLQPSYIAAAFDRKEPTFRHKQFAGYKATRKPMPDELATQIPLLKDILSSMGICCLELPGYEADDLLGTLSAAGRDAGLDVCIITGDKDSFQLADDNVSILQPVTRSGRTETERYDAAAIRERYQVTPEQFIDLKAIMGDPSDNIPGVKGIGEKGAIELISRYGSLEKIYDSLAEIRPAMAEKLRSSQQMAYLSRQLATICRHVPLNVNLEELAPKPADGEHLTALFGRLGFLKFMNRLNLQSSKSSAEQDQPARPQGQLSNAVRLSSDLSSLPFLPAIWLEDGNPMYWTVDSNQVSFLPYEQIQEAWQLIDSINGHLACLDYKRILRTTGLPALSAQIHDITVAAYLLNQIEGRFDLARIYQQATGRIMQEGDSNEETVASATPDKLVQPDLFSLAAEPAVQSQPDHSMLTIAIREVARYQSGLIETRGIQQLVYEIEMPLASILADMEKRGFLIDLKVLDQLAAEMDESLNDLQVKIFDLCGCRFNLNSPRQLGDVLFNNLGLATGKKRSGGAFSTDSEELERLSGEHPAIPLIIEYRQIAKLRSTYVEGLKKVRDPEDGRVHTTFNQILTATGRLSSSEPNLQNIPIRMEAGQKIRRAFIAAPGHILIDADYSQVELRLLAHLSGDPAMIEAFVRAEDIHTNTACRIFNLPPEEITPDMRSIAKTMNFSIVYGISDFGLARDLGVTVRQAHHYITEYEAQYPEIRHYLKSLVDKAYQTGYVETVTGRRRYMPELKSANRNLRQFGERAAMNTPVQGSAADLIKIAMVRAAAGLKAAGLQAGLILQVHDELIIESPVAEADRAAAILREAMEGAMQLRVPLLAEVHRGLSWAECK